MLPPVTTKNTKLLNASADFAHYIQSIIQLDELQKLTDNLNQELEESQHTMLEIKAMFDSLPNACVQEQCNSDTTQREEITQKILEAPAPNGLLPDMINSNSNELEDLDLIISSLKVRAEKLKFEYEKIVLQLHGGTRAYSFGDLAMNQYAASLDQLNKQIMNIKLTKKDVINKRSLHLEEKLVQLCQEVHSFSQMIQASTALNDSNKNWLPMEESATITQYESLIAKLLSGINEVSYLLQNKN